MPVHDWTRVDDGIFHDFHNAWMIELRNALNTGILPADYYALTEQITGPFGPDVLTLQGNGVASHDPAASSGAGKIALAVAPPKVRFTATTEMDEYVQKQKTLIIRHNSDDRIVALVEIVSRGNKASRHMIRAFVEKAAEALYRGFHLLIVDLHPPTPRDPQGIHGLIWGAVSDEPFELPPDKRLTLAAYSAGPIKRAFVEPVAVGDVLPEMPLFLEPEEYVNVPLEGTYQEAYHGVPQRWRRVLEATAS